MGCEYARLQRFQCVKSFLIFEKNCYYKRKMSSGHKDLAEQMRNGATAEESCCNWEQVSPAVVRCQTGLTLGLVIFPQSW